MSDNPPPQFGVRTLLIAVGAVAVVCSLVTWFGYTGLAGLAMIAVILAGGAGVFVGLLICSYTEMEFGFEDIRWDALKCLSLSTITVLTACGLAAWSPVDRLQAVTLVVAIFVMKGFWNDIEATEMIIVGIAGGSAAGITSTIIAHWAPIFTGA